MLQWGYIGGIGSISASSFASCIILLSLTISHPTLFPPIFFSAHNNSFWKTDTFMCNRCEQIFSTNVCIKVQDGSGYTQFRYICPLHAYFACLPPSEHIKTFHTWIRQSHWSLINVQISYIFAYIWHLGYICPLCMCVTLLSLLPSEQVENVRMNTPKSRELNLDLEWAENDFAKLFLIWLQLPSLMQGICTHHQRSSYAHFKRRRLKGAENTTENQFHLNGYTQLTHRASQVELLSSKLHVGVL